MKCDKCTKKATVHLTEIVDGKVMEMHLCEECAREQSQHMEQQFGLADLLAGLTDFGKQVPELQQKRTDALQCPACSLTYEDFRKFGRFGCAQCYIAFKPQLKGLFKKIHGSSAHLGKEPARTVALASEGVGSPAVGETLPPKPVDKLELLRLRLQTAIAQEDFEEAVALRDKIRALEGRG